MTREYIIAMCMYVCVCGCDFVVCEYDFVVWLIAVSWLVGEL
jgi:hypothetical protein